LNTFSQETPAETGMCEPRVLKTKATAAENVAGTKMYTSHVRGIQNGKQSLLQTYTAAKT